MRHRSSAFVLVYVILLVSLVGVLMTALASGTRVMIRQTNKVQVRAIQRNLQLSGMAWAARRARLRASVDTVDPQGAPDRLAPEPAVELDTTTLSSRPAQLSVLLSYDAAGRSPAAQIDSNCVYGAQTVRQNRTVLLD